jgi:hypothetical protein
MPKNGFQQTFSIMYRFCCFTIRLEVLIFGEIFRNS